jgi:hypothetical protein
VTGVELNRADGADHFAATLGQVDTFHATPGFDVVGFFLGHIHRAVWTFIDADSARYADGKNAKSHSNLLQYFLLRASRSRYKVSVLFNRDLIARLQAPKFVGRKRNDWYWLAIHFIGDDRRERKE